MILHIYHLPSKVPNTTTSTFRENSTFWLIKSERSNMLEGKALVQDSDMPRKMQILAVSTASQALDLFDIDNCRAIAAHTKKVFDGMYGGGWQCVVGSNFGCFFTHNKGTFIYFNFETLNFLLFKGATA